MKIGIVAALCVVSVGVLADTVVVQVQNTQIQNNVSTSAGGNGYWTSERIQKDPYGFLQNQLRNCDRLKDLLDAQNITLTRMEKEATRKIADAKSMITRYSKFLEEAKVAYKAAEEADKWPAKVNGYEMDEEELGDKIADALERVELAKKEIVTNEAILKKVGIRKGILKTKKRELLTLRRNMGHQAEQVKMNAALAELGALNDILGTMKDLTLEIDEDPTKMSLDDLTAEDPKRQRNGRVRDFLDK